MNVQSDQPKNDKAIEVSKERVIEDVLKERWERKKELDRNRIKSIPKALRKFRSKQYYDSHKEEIRKKNKERYHRNKPKKD